MKSTFLVFIMVVTTLVFTECKNASSDQADGNDSTVDKPVVQVTKIDNPDDSAKSLTFQLLQGKWQSMDDKSDFLVFDNNHRKEIGGGVDEWDDEIFILSDHCLNDLNRDNTEPKEKDKYITCKESDLCWYITSLDSNYLTLTYVLRGNELEYKRVKE